MRDALYGKRAGEKDTKGVLQTVIDSGVFEKTVKETIEFADASIRAL